jgi:hypothetical protein
MMSLRMLRHVSLGLAVLTAASGCNLFGQARDDDHVEVVSMRLTFTSAGTAPQVLNLTGAAGENRAVTLGVGTTTVSAHWLRADGQPDPVAHTAAFRLEATPPAGSGVTWALSSTSNHAGTLTIPGAVTNVQVPFSLFHVSENHPDFGPIPVTITAQ